LKTPTRDLNLKEVKELIDGLNAKRKLLITKTTELPGKILSPLKLLIEIRTDQQSQKPLV
jgi:hypothetical protein